MADNISKDLLKNGDIYNFDEAIETYGFDFESFAENNFEKFIETTFLNDFIIFRKSYLIRDFLQVRFYAHKFKGIFLLMMSKEISENCESIQMTIQKGDINVEKLYINIVSLMLQFLQEFQQFAKQIQKPIDQNLLDKFYDINQICDELEDFSVKNMLLRKAIDITDLTIDHKTKERSICCGTGDKGCIII